MPCGVFTTLHLACAEMLSAYCVFESMLLLLLCCVAGVRLHQPHSAARGPGEVAREPHGEAAATTHADRVRHQLALPAAGG